MNVNVLTFAERVPFASISRVRMNVAARKERLLNPTLKPNACLSCDAPSMTIVQEIPSAIPRKNACVPNPTSAKIADVRIHLTYLKFKLKFIKIIGLLFV
jgi:hypothetical protein